jgi:tetratricopeptide repeat protein 21B
MQLILLLKTKQIPSSKSKIKENLVKSKNLKFLPYLGQNIYFFRCTMLCADILLSKDKVAPAVHLINKALDYDKSLILLVEHQILLQKKGLKDKKKALDCLEEAVEVTQFTEPNLGYRLAQEYLAKGNFVKAYHVSGAILKNYPNFNELKANVLGPAHKKLLDLI